MPNDKAKQFEVAGESLMAGISGIFERVEQNALQRHRAYAADSGAKASLLGRYLQQDTWLVFSEAVPLAVGVIPKDWPHIKQKVGSADKRITALIRSDAGVSLKLINVSEKEAKWRIKPKDFMAWISAKVPNLAPNLSLEKGDRRIAVNSSGGAPVHGNSEVNALKREKVLSAALGVLAAFPDDCRKGGRISGMAIAKLIESKSPIWFGYEEPPLATRTMADLISNALKAMEK